MFATFVHGFEKRQMLSLCWIPDWANKESFTNENVKKRKYLII